MKPEICSGVPRGNGLFSSFILHPSSFLLGLCAVLFFTNLWGYDLWSPDEPRFGQVAREMRESGNFLAPHINGKPYTEKPPLLFWTMCIASLPFDDVTELPARMPSALAGMLTVLLTYGLATRMYGPRVGFWSGVVLATTALFWWEARTVRTDMLLTASLTVSLWALWRWHEERRAAWLALFYGAVAAALFAKGPPALVFPFLTLFVFYWKRKEDRRQTHWLLGLLCALAAVALWFVPARMAISVPNNEPAALGTLASLPASASAMGFELIRQIIGRMFLGVSHAEMPWYYLQNLPMTLFPWVLFLPWTVWWVWKHRHEGPPMRFLLSWIVPAFIFFSISIGKRPIYLLPAYSAVAILTARSVLDLMDGPHAMWRKRTAYAWSAVMLLFGAAPFALRFTEYRDIHSSALVVISVVAIAFGLNTLRQTLKTHMPHLHTLMASQFSGLAVLCVLLALPLINPHKSARAICEPLRNLSLAGREYRLYSVGFSREQYIYYARHFHEPVLTEPLDVAPPAAVARAERAPEQQYRVWKAISRAVENVPINSFDAVTPQEIDALAAQLHAAVRQAELSPQEAAAYEAALAMAVGHFALTFEQPEPAFMFVQEKDWRWLLPLRPEMRRYAVIGNRPVGSRDLLLIANEAGAQLVKKG